MNLNLALIIQLLILIPAVASLLMFADLPRFLNIGASRFFNLITWIVVLVSFFIPSALILGENGLIQLEWFPALGINFSFLADGLSYLAILFTSFTFLLFGIINRQQSAPFYGALLMIETSLVGLLLAINLGVFYFFYELMLFPIFYLMTVYGQAEARKAVYKFLLYTLAGSLLLLISIIYCGYSYQQETGKFSLEFIDLINHSYSWDEQRLLFLGFFLAFAVKSPIFPFHTWLPATYSSAPKGLTIIFGGLLFQAGIYGLFRFNFHLFPGAFAEFAPIMATLAVIGIVYGAMLAWRSKTIRGLLSYASISHVGFSILGLASMTVAGLAGGLLQIFSHILVAVGLFILAYAMERRRDSEVIRDFQGLAAKAPWFSFFLITLSLAAISLPLTISFVGEFQVLAASFQSYPILTSVALLGVIFGAVYMLGFCQQVLFGPASEEEFADLDEDEKTALTSILALIVLLGVMPRLVSDILTEQASDSLRTFQSGVGADYLAPKQHNHSLIKTNFQTKQHE